MLRIAIVDPSDFSRDPLRSLLLGVDFVWLEAECARFEFFADVIGQSVPDLAVVVLDADRNRALQLITQLAATYPHMPVLAIGSDHQALLQSLQRGAKYFLTQPVVLEELLTTLRRAQSDMGLGSQNGTPNPRAQQQGEVAAILGCRGGVGCTSIAVNLACTLASQRYNQSILIDLDMALGDADICLDLVPDHTLTDLALNIERLDMNFLKRSMMVHEATGVQLLSHPLRIEDIGIVHEEHLSRIINLLKVSYTHLILDLSKALMPTDFAALRLADHILLVTQLDLSSLRNAVRVLMALQLDEEIHRKIRVVVNRVGSDYQEANISFKRAEETIGMPIFWQIPNDSKAMLGARAEGLPLIVHAPKSRAQQSIAGLAQALFRNQMPAAPAGNGAAPSANGSPQRASFFSRMINGR
ncbi:MAG TPA: AAA family ATPase [Gemmataceae bacterium]|nr:AAA family ATPase [Gemmataceae bacterium]